MSNALRNKLIQESLYSHNPDVGRYFDRGYVKIERRLWDQVYSQELAAAFKAAGIPFAFPAGTTPKMSDREWKDIGTHVHAELKATSTRKSYKWKVWRQRSDHYMATYERVQKVNPNLKLKPADINKLATNQVRRAMVDFFSSGKFAKAAAVTLKGYTGGGKYATGQVEEHGRRGEDQFADGFSELGRNVGGAKHNPGKPFSANRMAKKARQGAYLSKGGTVSGAKGTRVEQRIVKSLAENLQKSAINPKYYDTFHRVIQAKWRDLFGYTHVVKKHETENQLKRQVIMSSNMVPNVDSYNPGDFDTSIGNEWRFFLKNKKYFMQEAARLLPSSVTPAFIDKMFNASPKYSDRLAAAKRKKIVKALFKHATSPDMRLKVNKRLLSEFKNDKSTSKSVSTKRGRTRGKNTHKKSKGPGMAQAATISRVEHKAGSNPMALRNLLNEVLPQVVARNMTAPALQYRTGRFANSVRVDNITQGPRGGNTMIEASYMNDPYETFAPGGKKYTQQRDPERLIKRSIREIATSMVGARFGIKVQ